MLGILDDILRLAAEVVPHAGAGGIVAFTALAMVLMLGGILLGFSKHVPENLRVAAMFVVLLAFVASILRMTFG